MTRRVGAAFVGLIVAILVGVVVPLGLETARHYRRDFVESTLIQAQATARIAEEHLSDHGPARSLTADLARIRARDETTVVLDQAGRPVAATGASLDNGILARAARVSRPAVISASDSPRVLVAVPITDGVGRSGTVVQSRSYDAVTDRIHELWTTLGVVAVLAVILTFLLAGWLSRWVGRPLRRLESVSYRVGAGELNARAGDIHGPAEVRRLAGTFDAMADRLQVLIANHRSVVADVSHQLRTPIAGLRLRLELLAEQPIPDRSEFSGVLDEVGRLSRMVDGLLAVARADALSATPADVDLAAAVTDRIAAWLPLAAEHGIELVGDSLTPVHVLAVLDHVQQVLDNLIANCLETDPPPRRVVVTTSGAGATGAVLVRDDGPGMTAEQRARVFDRFHTGRDGRGIGLGLAIVHRLVTSGGGTIEMTSTPGGGLTVTVAFPLARHSPRRALHVPARAGEQRR